MCVCVGDLFLPLPLLPAPPYPQVSALIEELAAGGSKELGVSLDSGVLERLLAYARSVAHFPTAIKEVGAPTPLVPLTWAACLCHPSLMAHACKSVSSAAYRVLCEAAVAGGGRRSAMYMYVRIHACTALRRIHANTAL